VAWVAWRGRSWACETRWGLADVEFATSSQVFFERYNTQYTYIP